MDGLKTVSPVDAFLGFMPRHEFNYHIHISLQNSYIYVEVPKVACSTIKSRLQEIEAKCLGQDPPSKEMAIIHNKKLSPLLSPADVGIAKFREMLQDPKVFKFCFVRNPYTRVLSAFLSKMRWKEGKYCQMIAAILEQSVEDSISFEQFLQAIQTQSIHEMDPHWRVQTSQLFWGQIQYDQIGRFETLESDWQKILARIGEKLPEQARLEAEVKTGTAQRGRKTGADDRLKSFYRQDSVQSLVQSLYHDDFTTFQYSLDLPF